MISNLETSYKNYTKAKELEYRESTIPYYSRESYDRTFFPAQNQLEFVTMCTSDVFFYEKWTTEESHIRTFAPKQDESILQKKILEELIFFLITESDFWKLKTNGQVYYLLNNAIASWSGYNHLYFLSKKSKELIGQRFSIDDIHSRCCLFNIRDEKRKKMLTFEHVVPVALQREFLKLEFLNGRLKTKNDLNLILARLGAIAVITQEENRIIRENKLNTSMGGDFDFENDSIWIRYNISGIQMDDSLVKVIGKMYR